MNIQRVASCVSEVELCVGEVAALTPTTDGAFKGEKKEKEKNPSPLKTPRLLLNNNQSVLMW